MFALRRLMLQVVGKNAEHYMLLISVLSRHIDCDGKNQNLEPRQVSYGLVSGGEDG